MGNLELLHFLITLLYALPEVQLANLPVQHSCNALVTKPQQATIIQLLVVSPYLQKLVFLVLFSGVR